MIKKVVIIATILAVGIILGVIGLVIWAFAVAEPITSESVQAAVNKYRAEKGVKPLEVDYELCNGIADRYIKLTTIKDTAHAGLQEWADAKYEKGFTLIAEVYGRDASLGLLMEGWQNSEGHNFALLNPEYTLDCTYVGPEGAVIVFGAR